MGYEVIDLGDLSALPDRTASGYEFSDHYEPLKTDEADPPEPRRGPERFGFRVYFVDPGEALGSGGMHYHEEQEEFFYVVSGELHVETPEETYRIGPEQAILIKPHSPQRAYVPAGASEQAYVVGVGAPSYRELGRNDGTAYHPESRE